MQKQPWVMIGLVVAMFATYAVQRVSSNEAQILAAEARLAAFAFFQENPDVEIGPRFISLVDSEQIREVQAAQELRRVEAGRVTMPQRIRDRTQAHFDELVVRAEETRAASSPVWRYGVTGADTPVVNYAAHFFVHDSFAALMVTLLALGLAGFTIELAWGSLFFGSFVLIAGLASAVASSLVYGETLGPWSGGTGIAAGLMGAYALAFIRGGILPGWIALPVWLFAENLVARGGWDRGTETLPIYAQLSGLSVGVLVAASLPLLRRRFTDKDHKSAAERLHSVLGRVTELRAEDKAKTAIPLLEEELKRLPGNREITVALWEVAVEAAEAMRAVPAMVVLIRRDLRQSRCDLAVKHWLSLTEAVSEFKVDGHMLVRMGEALLDEGHPEEAVEAMRRAVDGTPTLTAALAKRVVRVARDLDPGLARRAAALALADGPLSPDEQAELKQLAGDAAIASAGDEPVLSPPPSLIDEIPDATGAANASQAEPELSPVDSIAEGSGGEDLDPQSISPNTLQEQWESDLPEDLVGRDASGELSGLDPNALCLEDLEEGDLDLGSLSEPGAGESGDQTEELALHAVSAASLEGEGGGDGEGPAAAAADGAPERTDQKSATEPIIRRLPDTAVDMLECSRSLVLRRAVPKAFEQRGLSVEVDERGKTTIPFERIEALSVAAISGIADRPVLVVDVVTNWTDVSAPTLKVVRFRSDQFDPRVLAPAASSPVEAMRDFLAQLMTRTSAMPLPEESALRGDPFPSFDSLASYHREVLMVEGD